MFGAVTDYTANGLAYHAAHRCTDDVAHYGAHDSADDDAHYVADDQSYYAAYDGRWWCCGGD